MSIPTEHFAMNPVICLEESKSRENGSEPNSPMSHRHNMSRISGGLDSEETNCFHESLDLSINLKQSQLITSSLAYPPQNAGQHEYENTISPVCKNDEEITASLTSLTEQNSDSTQKPNDSSRLSSYLSRYFNYI